MMKLILPKRIQFCTLRNVTSGIKQVLQEQVKTNQGPEILSEECKKIQDNKTKGNSKKHLQEITEFFESKPHLKIIKDKISSNYIDNTYNSRSVRYCVDKDIAGDIYDAIAPYLKSHKGYVIELNAGYGVLSKYLLKAGIKRLRFYEADLNLHSDLHDLISHKQSDAEVIKGNLLTLGGLTVQDRQDDGQRVSNLFKGIPIYSWEDDPVISLIGVIPTEKFLLHMMHSVIFQHGICGYGRPQLFIAIPPLIYLKWFCTPEHGYHLYRSKTVLFQILFEHEKLLKVPDKAFIPWLKKVKPKVKSFQKYQKEEEGYLILVRLTARRDLFQNVPSHLMKPFWYFIKTMMYKRKVSVIALMEKWVPGCGPRLIAHGLTIFTKTGSLTPAEYLELFKLFASWPEFPSSTLLDDTISFISKVTEASVLEEELLESLKESKVKIKGDSNDEDEYDDDFDNIESVIVNDVAMNEDKENKS